MTRHRPTTTIRRLVRVWREVDYAQRRVFELRTGIAATDPWERF